MSELQHQPPKAGVLSEMGQNNKGLRAVASFISYVFHPLFMPLLLSFAVYKLSPNLFAGLDQKQVNLRFIMITLNTLFFPLLTIFLLKRLDFLKSYKMEDPKDRIIPLIAIMIFYFWTYQVAKGKEYPLLLTVLFLGNFWGIILVFLINIFLKVSMHTSAMGGVIGMMIVMMMASPINMTVPLVVAIVLAGIVGTARMMVQAHDIGEIWLGYIIGILVQVVAFLYLR